MTYLWINPVSERMISAAALEKLLKKHDLTRVVSPGHLLGEQDHVSESGGRRDHLRADDGPPAVSQSDPHAHENIRHGIGKHDPEKFLAIRVAEHGPDFQKLPVAAGKAFDDV